MHKETFVFTCWSVVPSDHRLPIKNPKQFVYLCVMKICCPNQLIGFYMRATPALNGLNKKSNFLYLTLPCLIVWGGGGCVIVWEGLVFPPVFKMEVNIIRYCETFKSESWNGWTGFRVNLFFSLRIILSLV